MLSETKMKAIVYDEYGPAEVLKNREISKPVPGPKEVLIKVYAATVTTGDVNIRGFTFVPKGFGSLPRLMFGWNRPRIPVLGTEVAGVVEAVGEKVSRFKKGERVFGIHSTGLGAYAEYVCRPESSALTSIPDNLSFEQAVALPFGALTALSFLRDKAKIKPGQKILVNGASGGVGSFAVQLATYFGAEVTGVCSTSNIEMVKSLGAKHVMDYTQTDFKNLSQTYDFIMDTVPHLASFKRWKPLLTPKGVYLSIAGGPKEMFQSMITSFGRGKKIIASPISEKVSDLNFIKQLAEAGHIKAFIDREYPLEKTAEAHRYVDTGRKRGSVVIRVT